MAQVTIWCQLPYIPLSPQYPLCANNDETSTPRKFNLEGVGNSSSWLCPARSRNLKQDKLRILAETGRAVENRAIGAILRREGVYSSTLSDWRRLRDVGTLGAFGNFHGGDAPRARQDDLGDDERGHLTAA